MPSPHPLPLPCGTWPSPLTPALAATGSVSLAYPGKLCDRLCWVEGRPAEKGRSVLVAADVEGTVQELVGPQANVRSRVHEYGGTPWAAVGDFLVWSQFDDQRLRAQRADGSVTVVTPPGCRYADGVGAPDGRTLVCVREDHRGAGEAVNSVVAVDLEATADEGRVLFGGSDFIAWPRLSPDGRQLALVAWDHPAMPWDETRLVVVDPDGDAAPVVVAGGPGESVLEPQWDTDGSLYFVSDRSGWWNLYRWRDGAVRAVTMLDAEIAALPWNLGARSYALTGDGRALVRITRGAVDTLWLLDLRTLALTEIGLPQVQFVAPGLLDADTAFAIAVAADAPPALITIDLHTGAHRVVRDAGAAPIPPAAVSRAEAIEFDTTAGPDGQGRTAHAWFYPPCLPGTRPAEGERPPLVVTLHGGPTSHAAPAWKLAVQFWTTRGFAVVDVNYGGSTSYGRAYRERLRGQWGVVDLQDAVAAVEHLVASGRVDGARVVIRGGSAGGFTVLSALAFTNRFAAGINYFGVADLEALATDTHKFESRYLDGLVAPLPEGREIYRSRSPVAHMGRCRAALLTLQGSDDRAVPPAQSRAITEAARAAGCPVAYLEFEGEGHGFRDAANIARGLEAELAFLGQVLRFAPAGDPPAIEIHNAGSL